MWLFLQKRLPAINAEELKDTGGQFKQDPLMKLQPISSGVPNVEIPGEGPIKIIVFLVYKKIFLFDKKVK